MMNSGETCVLLLMITKLNHFTYYLDHISAFGNNNCQIWNYICIVAITKTITFARDRSMSISSLYVGAKIMRRVRHLVVGSFLMSTLSLITVHLFELGAS